MKKKPIKVKKCKKRRGAAQCSWEPNKFLRTLYVVSGITLFYYNTDSNLDPQKGQNQCYNEVPVQARSHGGAFWGRAPPLKLSAPPLKIQK